MASIKKSEFQEIGLINDGDYLLTEDGNNIKMEDNT